MWLPANAQSPNAFSEDVVGEVVRVPAQPADADVAVPAPADLDTWVWQQYLLTWSLASKLGFAVGGVEGDFQSRVLVAEWSRSKTVQGSHNSTGVRFGVAARLVVHVRSIGAEANLSLPFVAAEAQMNRAEAQANMTIEGYVGSKAGDLFPSFSNFDVESYVKLMDAMTSAKGVIGGDEKNIKPVRLWCWGESTAEPTGAEPTVAAVATAWALTRIAEGNTLAETVEGYVKEGDPVARTAIERAYSSVDAGDGKPSDEAKDEAKNLLRGYKLHREGERDMR